MKDYEKDIILFVYKFKIVLSTNLKYLLGNKKYYQVIVKRLVDNGYLRRYKTKYLMLGQAGKKYIKNLGYTYLKSSYKKDYIKRITTASYVASIFAGNNIEFIPSFELKDCSDFRTQARPFIGSIRFNENDFLVYYISNKSTKHFCNSIIYDFQREHTYKQAILFVENFDMLKLEDYVFGSNQFLIIPLPHEKWIQLFNEQFKIDYRSILDELKYNNYFISQWYFCDYETINKKFITFLPFFDCEKIYKLMIFGKENKKLINNVHIICSKEVSIILKNMLPFLKVDVVNFKSYLKEIKIYNI